MLFHGIDIIEVARVRQAAERWGERFLARVFTPGELSDCGVGGPCPRYESLAVRWAAKEALAKAFGVGLSGLGAGPRDGRPLLHLVEIEVARGPGGRPGLRLHGEAAVVAATLGVTELALSLSHSGAHAVASVVGLGGGGAASPATGNGVE